VRRTLAWLVLGAAAAFACGSATERLELPSGKSVSVLGTGVVKFTSGAVREAALFKYETGLDLSDRNALREEVNEVWSVVRPSAERSQLSSWLVSPQHAVLRFPVRIHTGVHYSFTRQPDGSWVLEEPAAE